MDYQSLIKHTEAKMGAFLDQRINELLATTYRQDLEELAEKICFQNLVSQYRRRKLPIPISLEKRLNYEAIERKTAKAQRRATPTIEGEAGELLPATQRLP